MQDDHIVAEVLELKFLDLWYDAVDVVLVSKDAEVEHKNRIVAIDLLKGVIATLVDINDKIAEVHTAVAPAADTSPQRLMMISAASDDSFWQPRSVTTI